MPPACAAASAAAICAAYSSACGSAQRSLCEQAIERRAVDQLHRDERHAVGFVDVVDRDDVRVVERRRGLRFPDEPGVAIGIRRRVGRQHLDRERAAEARVHGAVHDAHAAAADFFLEAIMRNELGH